MHVKLPVNPKEMKCSCSTAQWGNAATQSLFHNFTQSAFGGILTTPSGLVKGNKLLAAQHDHLLHLLRGGDDNDGSDKPKCPFAQLREMGLLRGPLLSGAAV